jgi:hypothetical protein
VIVQAVFDEAGDTGTAPRASRYLIVAGVVSGRLEPLRTAVTRTRKSLRKQLRAIPELKARHTPPPVIRRFLARIAALDIEIYAVVLDKSSAKRPPDAEDWYRQVCAEAVHQVLGRHPQVIATFDRRYTKAAQRDVLTRFIVVHGQSVDTALSLVYGDSQSEAALQVADVIAWSLFQKVEHGDDSYYAIIRERLAAEVILSR